MVGDVLISQHTPRINTAPEPSSVIVPPLAAEVVVILVISVFIQDILTPHSG
jgi:hypothetical protein